MTFRGASRQLRTSEHLLLDLESQSLSVECNRQQEQCCCESSHVTSCTQCRARSRQRAARKNAQTLRRKRRKAAIRSCYLGFIFGNVCTDMYLEQKYSNETSRSRCLFTWKVSSTSPPREHAIFQALDSFGLTFASLLKIQIILMFLRLLRALGFRTICQRQRIRLSYDLGVHLMAI